MGHGGKLWVSDFNDPNYITGRKAMKTGKLPPIISFEKQTSH